FMTALLFYKSLPAAQTQALENDATQITAPPLQKTAPSSGQETEMFRKYEQSLRESAARQAHAQAQEQKQRNFSRTKWDI
ncbi:hypothetical protein VSS93_31185, partial [Pseudomonas syringae pv. tagetis]